MVPTSFPTPFTQPSNSWNLASSQYSINLRISIQDPKTATNSKQVPRMRKMSKQSLSGKRENPGHIFGKYIARWDATKTVHLRTIKKQANSFRKTQTWMLKTGQPWDWNSKGIMPNIKDTSSKQELKWNSSIETVKCKINKCKVHHQKQHLIFNTLSIFASHY